MMCVLCEREREREEERGREEEREGDTAERQSTDTQMRWNNTQFYERMTFRSSTERKCAHIWGVHHCVRVR